MCICLSLTKQPKAHNRQIIVCFTDGIGLHTHMKLEPNHILQNKQQKKQKQRKTKITKWFKDLFMES